MIDNLTSVIPGWNTTIIPLWFVMFILLIFCLNTYVVNKNKKDYK